MRIGIAHHLGWAVAVTADDHHQVVDRRRIELVGPDLPAAPIHHEGGPHELHRSGPPLTDDELIALVDRVRASMEAVTRSSLDQLVADLGASTAGEPVHVRSISLVDWPATIPEAIAVLRQPPWEAKADSIHYRQVLAADATARGWAVHRFDPKRAEAEAAEILGPRADDVLTGPRARLGPPWAKDHRMALAATVLATHAAP